MDEVEERNEELKIFSQKLNYPGGEEGLIIETARSERRYPTRENSAKCYTHRFIRGYTRIYITVPAIEMLIDPSAILVERENASAAILDHSFYVVVVRVGTPTNSNIFGRRRVGDAEFDIKIVHISYTSTRK